jgi:hypothetical protein
MAMSLGKVCEPFIEQSPICVMARGVLENLFLYLLYVSA